MVLDTLHMKAQKVKMGTQTTGRRTRTKPISRFNKDYTGQFSGVAGYDFLQRKNPRSTFQPPGSELDLRPEPESDTPATCWETAGLRLTSKIRLHLRLLRCNPIWSHFRFVIMEWRRGRFWANQNGLHRSKRSKDYIPDRALAFGFRVSKGSDVTCGVLCVLLRPHMCARYMMKVWAVEWSEWLWCQTLTSCGFSCPSLRRYLKSDSVPQISHVAYICTEIPPRAIGCFEMGVNMKLFGYLAVFIMSLLYIGG